MAQGNAPIREQVRDRNAERAAFNENAQSVQVADTFAPVQSRVFGQTNVQTSPVLTALANFGTEVGRKEMQKQAESDFLHGQALRSTGQTLAEGAAPPTRKGFEAMDAKLTAEAWVSEQRKRVDAEENAVDSLEYPALVSKRFQQEVLGDDPDRNRLLTTAAAPLFSELAKYQTKANVKRRQADAITQATTSVTNGINDLLDAQKSGDQEGEAAARARVLSGMNLGNIADPVLRQQTYAQLAALGLELGDTTPLNYVRENEIPFTPEQQSAVESAETQYEKAKRAELNLKYQHAKSDLESNVASASGVAQAREIMAEHQVNYPDRETNDYYVGLERKFRTNMAKKMAGQVASGAYGEKRLPSVSGLTPKQVQEAIRTEELEIDQNPGLTDQQKHEKKLDLYAGNGLKHDDKQRRWNAGLTQPFTDTGEINPKFVTSFQETIEHYRASPDLTMQHLKEENRTKFIALKNLTEDGDMELRDAAALIRQNEETLRDLSSDERNKLAGEVQDQIDSVMGKGFFSQRAWTDAFGGTEPIKNEGFIRNRMQRLASTYMQTGYPDPEAAAEAARIKIMETHEQVGNSLVYRGDRSINDRLGGVEDTQAAIQWQKDQIAAANPDLDPDRMVLMGDPLSNGLLFGQLNDFDVIDQVVSVDLAAAGEAYRQEVEYPMHVRQQEDLKASAVERKQTQLLMQRAIDSGIYTKSQAEAALSNWVGRTVLSFRVNAWAKKHNEDKAIRLFEENHIRSREEFDAMLRTDKAMHSRNTPEQERLLEAGELDLYEQDKLKDLPDAPDNTSADAFVGDAMTAAESVLGGSDIFPEVAVAMSALESGWGRSVKGNNYFGIKGQGQTFTTHEVIDGKRVKIQDEFNVYKNYVDALQGLRKFLYENPRYSDALDAPDAETQIREIAKAGYATDPAYAEKLINIINQPRFK